MLSNSVFSLAGGAGVCTALWADSVSALAVVGEKGLFVERISGVCTVGVFLEHVSGAILSYSNTALNGREALINFYIFLEMA